MKTSISILFLAVLLFSIAGICHATPMYLSLNGTAQAVIVDDANATTAEETAATELQSYLNQITGGSFQIVSSAPPNTPRILIGATTEARSLAPDVNWNALGSDGIVIRRVSGTNTLILAGGRPRGTLYAVYTFLEDTLGCQWWTHDASSIPSIATVSVDTLSKTYVPPFFYRSVDSLKMYEETGHFGAQLKLNGDRPALPASLGGHISIDPFVHSFFELLPPATYFNAHPAWYSESGGTRVDNQQLCLSNSDMRAQLVTNALARIAANPAGIISISQNDGGLPCTCTNCLALDATYGGPSGTMIHFVNQCATAINAVYPDYKIETLAYQYSRTAPTVTTTIANSNVIVRLCSIEADYSTALDSTRNTVYFNDLQNWKDHSSNIFIWDYVWNYHQQLIPHPNWQVLGPNISLYKDNNVTGVFEQDDRFNASANFQMMRTWMLAHMMWDPNVNQSTVMNTFLNGYYGAAGPYLRNFIDLMSSSITTNFDHLACWNDDPAFLTSSQLQTAKGYFDQAATAVSGDSVLTARVNIERTAFNHLVLLNRLTNPDVAAWVTQAEANSMATAFVTASVNTDNHWVAEAGDMRSDYASILNGSLHVSHNGLTIPTMTSPVAAPAMIADQEIPATQWIDLQESRFDVFSPNSMVTDTGATNGVAVALPGRTVSNWSLTTQLIASDCNAGKVKLYIRAKTNYTSSSGVAFYVGVWDTRAKCYLLCTQVTQAQMVAAGATTYHDYYIGEFTPNQASQIYINPRGDPAGTQDLYIDRMFLVKTELTKNGLRLPATSTPADPQVVTDYAIAASHWFDMQENRMALYSPNILVADSTATNGVAVKVPGQSSSSWSVQAPFAPADCHSARVKLYIRARTTYTSTSGNAFYIGVWDDSTSSYLLSTQVTQAQMVAAGATTYHDYYIGEFTPTATAFVYINPYGGDTTGVLPLYIDRIYTVTSGMTVNDLIIPSTTNPAAPAYITANNIPSSNWFDLQENRFSVASPNSVETDNAASDSVTTKLPGRSTGSWTLTMPCVPHDDDLGSVKLYVTAKNAYTSTSGTAFNIGVWDTSTNSYVLSTSVTQQQMVNAGATTYHDYYIGTFTPTTNRYVYVSPLGDPSGTLAIRIDRMFLVKQ